MSYFVKIPTHNQRENVQSMKTKFPISFNITVVVPLPLRRSGQFIRGWGPGGARWTSGERMAATTVRAGMNKLAIRCKIADITTCAIIEKAKRNRQ